MEISSVPDLQHTRETIQADSPLPWSHNPKALALPFEGS